MNTEQFAARLGIKAQSVRARVCRTGSYYGERPITLPNGRLSWDDAAPERLLAAGQAKAPDITVAAA